MQVTILLDNPPEITITDIHPVNLPDVCQNAVDMALRLQQALTHHDTAT